MRLAWPLLLVTIIEAATAAPSVSEHFGNIEFDGGQGFIKTLTSDHKSGRPALSPDGRTIAWIHIDRAQSEPDEAGATSLWIADGITGAVRKLAGESHGDDVRSNIINPENAAFSLDGGFVYVTSQLGTVNPGIHQVRVSTGQHRFVVAGALERVIRTGPYRGYLIVNQHRYYDPPKEGSYNASYVIRPDAKEILMIPGSDKDGDPGAVDRWLATKEWKAW
jgi:hypothetical protein